MNWIDITQVLWISQLLARSVGQRKISNLIFAGDMVLIGTLEDDLQHTLTEHVRYSMLQGKRQVL